MKREEIILDFTSLLDVTLIVIFFFVIFSNLDSENNRAKTEQAVSEYESMMEAAEKRENEATKLVEQLEKDLEIIKKSDENMAENLEEMMNYAKGQNLKILLEIESNTWKAKIICGNEKIAEIDDSDDFADKMLETLKTTKYKTDDTIFCDLVFDGSVPGSRKAYVATRLALDEIKDEYRNFYYSETDLSVGED